MRYDFAAYDKDGNLAVVVEAILHLNTDAVWASELRRNILAHGALPRADFFMVVVPDKIYVWNGRADPQAEPAEIDARDLFAPYFERIGISPETIVSAAFEQLVFWWLNDLARSVPADVDARLRQSGIVDVVAGGHVLSQLAA